MRNSADRTNAEALQLSLNQRAGPTMRHLFRWSRSVTALGFLVLAVALAVACESHPTDPKLTEELRLTLLPDSIWLAPGDTQAVQLEIRDTAGVTVQREIRWESSDVAVAIGTTAGVVAVAPGTARVVGRAGTGSDSVFVTVTHQQDLLTLLEPAPGQVVEDEVEVVIRLTQRDDGAAPVRRTARVGSVSQDLDPVNVDFLWSADLPLEREPRGLLTLTAEVEYADGVRIVRSVAIVNDGPPWVDISSPGYEQAVTGGSYSIAATCGGEEEYRCTSLRAYDASSPSEVLAEGENSVQAEVSFFDDGPTRRELVLVATDARGRESTVRRTFYTLALPAGLALGPTLPGLVRDYDGLRAAWATPQGDEWRLWAGPLSGPSVSPFAVSDASAEVYVVEDGLYTRYTYDFAVGPVGRFFPVNEAWEITGWTDFYTLDARAGSYHVGRHLGLDGTFALRRGGGPEGLVTIEPAGVFSADVGANGVVTYNMLGGDTHGADTIFWYDDGTTEAIGVGGAPRTDGTLVAFARAGELLVRRPDGSEEVVGGHFGPFDVVAGRVFSEAQEGLVVLVPGGGDVSIGSVSSWCVTSDGTLWVEQEGASYQITLPYGPSDWVQLYGPGLPPITCVGNTAYTFLGSTVFLPAGGPAAGAF